MDTSKSITLGQAFAHCASTGSYWLWIALAVAACGLISFLWYKAAKKAPVNIYVQIALTFIMVAMILCSIFIRPCDVHVNTSVDAAARGHYLGY